MIRKIPTDFAVIIDTNAIFPKDPTNVAAPRFLKQWMNVL